MTKLCEMGTTYSCLDTKEALTGLRMARMAIGRGQLGVVPTDTVYGIAADAFNPDAVNALLALGDTPLDQAFGELRQAYALVAKISQALRELGAPQCAIG